MNYENKEYAVEQNIRTSKLLSYNRFVDCYCYFDIVSKEHIGTVIKYITKDGKKSFTWEDLIKDKHAQPHNKIFIYNFNNIDKNKSNKNKVLYITEGEKDVKTMLKLGFQNTISIRQKYFESITEKNFIEVLKHYSRVIMFVDNDNTGIKKFYDFKSAIDEFNKTSIQKFPELIGILPEHLSNFETVKSADLSDLLDLYKIPTKIIIEKIEYFSNKSFSNINLIAHNSFNFLINLSDRYRFLYINKCKRKYVEFLTENSEQNITNIGIEYLNSDGKKYSEKYALNAGKKTELILNNDKQNFIINMLKEPVNHDLANKIIDYILDNILFDEEKAKKDVLRSWFFLCGGKLANSRYSRYFKSNICNFYSYDFFPILIGHQGCGKSFFLNQIFSFFNEFASCKNIDIKEKFCTNELLCDNLAVNIEEIDGVFKSDHSHKLKAMISSNTSFFGRKYEKAQDHFHTAIFAASTNKKNLFKETENRRFITINIPKGVKKLIDFNEIESKFGKDYLKTLWCSLIQRTSLYRPEQLSKYHGYQNRKHAEIISKCNLQHAGQSYFKKIEQAIISDIDDSVYDILDQKNLTEAIIIVPRSEIKDGIFDGNVDNRVYDQFNDYGIFKKSHSFNHFLTLDNTKRKVDEDLIAKKKNRIQSYRFLLTIKDGKEKVFPLTEKALNESKTIDKNTPRFLYSNIPNILYKFSEKN